VYDYEYDMQEATIWTLVMQTRDAISQLSKRQLAKVGLTPEKWHTLLLCVNSTEPVTIAKLSRMLYRKPHTVSGLLNRMEAEELLKREKQGPQKNQGPMSIRVTNHGRKLYKQGMNTMMGSVVRCVERVPKDELNQLEGGLRSLRNSILREMNVESHKMTVPLR